MQRIHVIPRIDVFLGHCTSRLLTPIACFHGVQTSSPGFSGPVAPAKLTSSNQAEVASRQVAISERVSAPVRIRTSRPRPVSDSFVSHTRNLSDASTVAENLDSVQQTLFAPNFVLPSINGHHTDPLNTFAKHLLNQCATLTTELKRYKTAPVSRKKVVTIVPGLENEVQRLEGVVNRGAGHVIENRAAPRHIVDRLALVCDKVTTEVTAAQNLTTQLANQNQFLSQTVIGLNGQLQDQVAVFNQQVGITNHLSGLYDQLRQTATLQLNWQVEATNNIAAQYEHLRQTATVRIQEGNRRYDDLVTEHAQRIEQWALLQERATLEGENTLAHLREAREEVDRVMPTIQLLQENVETFERRAEDALARERAVKEENNNLRNVLWAKTKQLEESERALQMSQKLHQKDADRVDHLSRELHELQSQNETDIRVAAAKILETDAQLKAEQDVNMALTQQNTLLREVFRQRVEDVSSSSSANISAISSGTPDLELLLDANKQQEALVAWLERELSYASWTRYAAKDLEDQLAVNLQQKNLIKELKGKNKEVDEKVFTEEIQNANLSEHLQQSEAHINKLSNTLEEARHEVETTRQAVNQLSNTNKQLLGQRLSREQLLYAEGWIVDRLQAHLELKDEEIAALTNQVAGQVEETARVREIAGMNIDLLRDEMYSTRQSMGNTIIFAEANYRERDEAYAKLRAFEKRFADELAVEPLVPEPAHVAFFDEVAPEDFKERREAAWRWAYGENEYLAGVESKAWYNLTPNDIHRIRAAHGIPPANLVPQA